RGIPPMNRIWSGLGVASSILASCAAGFARGGGRVGAPPATQAVARVKQALLGTSPPEAATAPVSPPPARDAAAIGIFEEHGDVGTVLHPGNAGFDENGRVYSLSGSGENMWSVKDAFHFA